MVFAEGLCRRPCSELAAKLVLDKSVTGRRLRDATDRRYLVNLETRRGRPTRIVVGDPMPEMVKLLPGLANWVRDRSVAPLQRCGADAWVIPAHSGVYTR
jgi:hypothetical protein